MSLHLPHLWVWDPLGWGRRWHVQHCVRPGCGWRRRQAATTSTPLAWLYRSPATGRYEKREGSVPCDGWTPPPAGGRRKGGVMVRRKARPESPPLSLTEGGSTPYD